MTEEKLEAATTDETLRALIAQTKAESFDVWSKLWRLEKALDAGKEKPEDTKDSPWQWDGSHGRHFFDPEALREFDAAQSLADTEKNRRALADEREELGGAMNRLGHALKTHLGSSENRRLHEAIDACDQLRSFPLLTSKEFKELNGPRFREYGHLADKYEPMLDHAAELNLEASRRILKGDFQNIQGTDENGWRFISSSSKGISIGSGHEGSVTYATPVNPSSQDQALRQSVALGYMDAKSAELLRAQAHCIVDTVEELVPAVTPEKARKKENGRSTSE